MAEAEATKVTARPATLSVVDNAKPPFNSNQPNQRRQPRKIKKEALARRCPSQHACVGQGLHQPAGRTHKTWKFSRVPVLHIQI